LPESKAELFSRLGRPGAAVEGSDQITWKNRLIVFVSIPGRTLDMKPKTEETMS
jgi:hypothetical protein